VVLILYDYRDGETGTNGVRLGISVTRIEPVNSGVRLVSRDAGFAERRLSCSVIPVSDCNTGEILSEKSKSEKLTVEEDDIAKRCIHSLGNKCSRPIIGGIAPDGDDNSLRSCTTNTGKKL
jgi:hypothetical protein